MSITVLPIPLPAYAIPLRVVVAISFQRLMAELCLRAPCLFFAFMEWERPKLISSKIDIL